MSLEQLPSAVLITVSRDLDLSAIEALIRDTAADFLPSLIEVFEHETFERIECIQTHLDEGSLDAIPEQAQSLRGSAKTFGATHLMYLADTVADAARRGEEGIAQATLAIFATQRVAAIGCLNIINEALNAGSR